MDNTAIAHAIFDAAEARDVEKFLSYFAADAMSWHNFDAIDQPIAEAGAQLRELMKIMKSVTYVERRYIAIPDGAVLQHTTTAVLPDDSTISVPTMARIHIDGSGKVRRLEEYFDSRQAGM